jgi:hypothetical protein
MKKRRPPNGKFGAVWGRFERRGRCSETLATLLSEYWMGRSAFHTSMQSLKLALGHKHNEQWALGHIFVNGKTKSSSIYNLNYLATFYDILHLI